MGNQRALVLNTLPANPAIYHIAHVDKLKSIISDGYLWSDAEARRRRVSGTVVGMQEIKDRRLGLNVSSRQGLCVGECAPFYFCPRSVMLYLLHRGNHPGVTYTGGQEPIVHLVADLHQAAAWCDQNDRRWAFTLSNAGSNYFEDRSDLAQLSELNWDAIGADQWSGDLKEGKQAEFLMEQCCPWELVQEIAVYTERIGQQAMRLVGGLNHRPAVQIRRNWYY